eukprot:1606160-Prymnesium_polylepis.2
MGDEELLHRLQPAPRPVLRIRWIACVDRLDARDVGQLEERPQLPPVLDRAVDVVQQVDVEQVDDARRLRARLAPVLAELLDVGGILWRVARGALEGSAEVVRDVTQHGEDVRRAQHRTHRLWSSHNQAVIT